MASKRVTKAATVVYGAKAVDPDLAIGREVVKSKRGALRYMCEPERDGLSIAHARLFTTGMDVHFSSGVFNRAFCLLARSKNWNIRKAFEVFLRANQNFWAADTSFAQAADGALQAAGALGYEIADVKAVFDQVGVTTGTPVAVAPAPITPAPHERGICSYLGDDLPASFHTAQPTQDALVKIGKIMLASGLAQNFTVESAAIPNAAALIIENKRKVLYSSSFLDSLDKQVNSRWAAYSVLAHEIGHHLNGHTLGASGSQPQVELEADRFSGFILERLGASLKEAQAVIEKFGGQGSSTHPAKKDRLAAIASGWHEACSKDADCVKDGQSDAQDNDLEPSSNADAESGGNGCNSSGTCGDRSKRKSILMQ